MAGKSGVWVFYYLQGEDGDSVETPNAFNIVGAVSEVRLGQFVQAFPLRRHGGEYHFRFRAADPVMGYCWLDLKDPSAVLPRYGNAICAKVLRLDRLPKPRSSRLRRKAPYGQGAAGTGAAGVGVDHRSPVGGTTSWRAEETQRRQQQWSTQGGQRPHSASPIGSHGQKVHHDDVSKGKSVTPPPSHGGGNKGAQPSRGSPPAPPPTPPPPPPQRPPQPSSDNLEEFLFSDSPPGSPTSTSPRSQTGRGNSGPPSRSTGGGKSTNGQRSGEDLLNFGNDSSAAARAKEAPEPPPRPAGSSGGGGEGRSPVPPGWGNRPTNGGASPPGRKSTAGRMQGRPDGLGGGANGGPRSNEQTNSGGGPGAGAGAGPRASGTATSTSGLHRPNSFSGAAAGKGAGAGTGAGAGGPELMNFNNSPRAGGGGGAGAQSSYVKTKVQEREAELKANVKSALDFKKGIDAAAMKDQDDLDAAKVKHDAMLTAWAEDHGKKKNVRTLLSTMHTVLWEGNRWKPVSMADIIQPSKVKMAYRKAMLQVHPDKCGSLGPEARLIAKRVFEAVNEAYTVFAEKENP
eukprot:g20722.t2